MRVKIPWGMQSYTGKSVPLSAQELINLYAEAQPQGGKDQVALFRTPGTVQFGTVASKTMVRGLGMLGSTVYAVIDDGFYSLGSDGTLTLLGAMGTTTGLVEMASTASRLAIADGYYGYWYTTGGGFVQITDPDLAAPRSVTTLDGWFIWVKNDTSGQFQITNTADFDGLDYATAESKPDSLVKAFSDHRELWLFGDRSTEVWYNSGNADFAFEKIQGALLERGLGAQHSVAQHDNTVIWLGDDGIIYAASQYQPKRISTHAIEQDIASMSSFSDAVAFSHTWEGHKFYVISFPTGQKTYCFDSATRMWHRRSWWNSPNHERVRGHISIDCYGKTLLGDRSSGDILYFDEVYTDDSGTILWEVCSPTFADDQQPGIVTRLQVDFEAGASLVTGQGSDSQVFLQVSRDGGRTWGSESWASIGAIGEFSARTVWRRLGRYRKGLVFRLRGGDPIKAVMGNAYMSIERGADGD